MLGDLYGQGALEDLEMLGGVEMVVAGYTGPGLRREVDEGVLAAGLGAGAQEHDLVALDRVLVGGASSEQLLDLHF